MKKNILIFILLLVLKPLSSQYFQKHGDGLSIKTFFHQQGINYYLHERDSNGQIFAIYYDTVTSSFNFGHEYSQIRLQIFDGISWLFSKPIRLYNRYSIDAPRILDIKFLDNDIYVCGSFDSSQNNSGAGIIKFSNRTWQSCGAQLLQTNPDYFEVNKCYPFQNQLLIAGNFDSVPGIKVKGLLLWNGSVWNPVGKAGTYGFNHLSGTSNVFFQVSNDSLYAFNKNKITPDSMEIGGQINKKLSVFRNGQFEPINIPVKYIAGISSYEQKLVIIPSSSLVYISSILLWDAGTWKSFLMPDSFYATSFIAALNTNNSLYLLFQNGDTKMMSIYQFNGSNISRLSPFRIADTYLPLESKVWKDRISIAGNFVQVKQSNYSDSFQSIADIIFQPKSIYCGTTFIDLNNDQVRQAGEPVLPHCKVYSIDNQMMALSDGSGKVNMILPTGQNFTLKAINDRGYICNQSYMINTGQDSIYSSDFGFIPSNTNDVSVKIFSHTANKAKQGFKTGYTVHLTNYSNVNQLVNIQITLNAKCSNFMAENFTPIALNQKGFHIDANIKGQEKLSFSFSCIYAVDSFSLGEKVFTGAFIALYDASKTNNRDTVPQTVVAAFDPNIKVAFPDILANVDREIKYTIFFQNLGNDTALNVTVVDSFGSLFNLSKVVYLNTGPIADVEPEIINNTLVWHFKHINLPPKKHDSIGSIGFVNLSSGISKNAKIGDTIFNKAAIFFDYQKPVITNKARVIFVKNDAINRVDSLGGFNVFPNPGHGNFTYLNPYRLSGELIIFSVDGKLVYSTQLLERGEVQLPDTLSNGVYILKISSSSRELGKLIIAE